MKKKAKKRIRWSSAYSHVLAGIDYKYGDHNEKKAERYRILAIKALGGKP